ncbi:MAG: hypothetical protein QXU40_00690 [Candidatus Pacearchaeota archaeon]
MSRENIKEINITQQKGALSLLKRAGLSKDEYSFEDLPKIRQILTKERLHLINAIKVKKPDSIYNLSKELKRGFKGVRDDIKLLEEIGVLEIVSEKSGNRIRHKPRLIIDTLTINIHF